MNPHYKVFFNHIHILRGTHHLQCLWKIRATKESSPLLSYHSTAIYLFTNRDVVGTGGYFRKETLLRKNVNFKNVEFSSQQSPFLQRKSYSLLLQYDVEAI